MKMNRMILTGIAVATLAVMTLAAQAQERYMSMELCTNVPAYYTNATTYVTNGSGVITTNASYYGGLNTALNSSGLYTGTNGATQNGNVTVIGGQPFYLGDYQNISFGVLQSVILTNPFTTTIGTNGISVDSLDLTPDGVIWFSNKVYFTNVETGAGLAGPVTSSTYTVSVVLPTVGTNWFEAWRFARWGQHLEQGTNNAFTLQRFTFLRYK